MDLILWRHADAEDGIKDLARRLTPKGLEQAARMAAWLDSHLPRHARVLVSPAERAQQTAKALSRSARTDERIAPGAAAAEILEAAGWPRGDDVVVIVGHQPSLGMAAALALTGTTIQWRIRSGAVWWISIRDGESQSSLEAVVTPDFV